MNDITTRTQLIADFGQCHADVLALIQSPQPEFLARIGGSDTDVVVEYFDLISTVGLELGLQLIQEKFEIVRRFNGYYDKANDPANIGRFCQLLISSYQQCSQLTVCGAPLLTEFFPDAINPVFQEDTSGVRRSLRKFIDAISLNQQSVRFYPYPYIERLLHGQYTLFNAFAQTLPGKKVLAVTPFEQSIRANFPRRHEFFPNYAYPEFELLTYNTPITYAGLPAEFYPDNDWFETLERIKHEISGMDFDIALLSCGSYALPLGLHIRDVLKRKAIYVGGCLQLYFGVTGRRYDNPFFIDQINPAAFIQPIERERFLPHVTINSTTSREAFGAYF